MKQGEKILIGEKQSNHLSSLSDFESLSCEKWKTIRQYAEIPDGFLFLVGVLKYRKKGVSVNFKFGKDRIFVQNMLPHGGGNGTYRTRKYDAFYALYEPETMSADDIVFEESAIYQALPDNTIRLILANGEHRNAHCIDEMFAYLRAERGLQNFARENTLPGIYEVTFNKSCGYFLKGRTYHVWAVPVGIPDGKTGIVDKGWLLCDINCGVPAVMNAEREEFIPLTMEEGAKIGLFTLRNDTLVFER